MPNPITGGWRVGDAGHTVFGPKKPDGTLPEVIATVRKPDHARVIAAAPELLAALRVLVDHAQERYPHFESERGQKDVEVALQAIQKAGGRV